MVSKVNLVHVITDLLIVKGVSHQSNSFRKVSYMGAVYWKKINED